MLYNDFAFRPKSSSQMTNNLASDKMENYISIAESVGNTKVAPYTKTLKFAGVAEWQTRQT